ncbi:hypothetical protein [Rhodococcus jostii]
MQGAPSAEAQSALPSPAELTAKINGLAHVGVGLDVVEGAGPDPSIYDPRATAAGLTPPVADVIRVDPGQNGEIIAVSKVIVNGQLMPELAQIPFVNDGGQWKIDREWACNFVAADAKSDPACP